MVKELVEQIQATFKARDIEVPSGEIEKRLKMLIEEYKVPESEARRSVVNYFLKESGVQIGEF